MKYVEIKCQLDATFPHINDDARSKSHQISCEVLVCSVSNDNTVEELDVSGVFCKQRYLRKSVVG